MLHEIPQSGTQKLTRFIFLYYNDFAVKFEFILYGSEQFVNENKIGAICINIRTQIKQIKRSFGFVKYMVLLFGVLAVSLCAAVALFTKDFRTVTISADGKLYEITTRADTVAEAVEAAGIVLGAEDKVNYDLSCSVDEVVGIVTVSRPLTLTVNLANDRRIITTYSDNVSDALAENDIPFDESKDIILGAEDGAVCDGDEITIVIKSTKTVEEQEEIPFDTVYVEDNTLYEGDTEVVTAGKNGVVTRTYTVKLEDGVEISRELVSEVRTEPVNRVVAKGTKVYFTNSRGLSDSFTQQYEMRATAYAPTPENHGYATASGNRARDGVVAVDPDVIPLGTKLYVKSNVAGIPDYGYCIAWDVGGSIKDMRIDLFMESEYACYQFGLRSVTVYVLEDQSIDVFSLRG